MKGIGFCENIGWPGYIHQLDTLTHHKDNQKFGHPVSGSCSAHHASGFHITLMPGKSCRQMMRNMLAEAVLTGLLEIVL